MIVPDSAKLLMVMAGFFLYDSAMLLYANEAVLCLRKRKWLVEFGSPNVTIAGKSVYVASVFALHRPIFRAAWHDCTADKQPAVDLATINQSLYALAPFAYLSLVAQFIFLPLVLFLSFTTENLILAAILIYSYIALSGIVVFRKRAHWGLTTKQATALILECLLCPPIALNLVRRISLSFPIKEDLSVIAKTLLSDEDWHALRTRMEIHTETGAFASTSNDAE